VTVAAMCEQRLGRPDEALHLLREALALDPEYLPAKLELGPLLLERGRHGEAIAVLEDAVRGAPYNSQAHFYLSQAYAARGRREQADEQLRLMKEAKVVEREFNDLHEQAAGKPEDADIRYRIGVVARRLGKPDLARLWFRAALAIKPDHFRARTALAETEPAEP